MGRGAFSQIILLFLWPMGPLGLGHGPPKARPQGPWAHSRELGGNLALHALSCRFLGAAGAKPLSRLVSACRACSFAPLRILLLLLCGAGVLFCERGRDPLRETGMRAQSSPRHSEQNCSIIHTGSIYAHQAFKNTHFGATPKTTDASYGAQPAPWPNPGISTRRV